VLKKSFLADEGKFLGPLMRFARGDVRASFHPKSTTDFVAALQSVAAIEGSKNRLSRNFQGRSIFDFCNMG
jgi:hypothetical protein